MPIDYLEYLPEPFKAAALDLYLEVIDTNPRAEALYRHLGFKVVKQRNIHLFNFFFNFSFQSSRLMVKSIR